MNRRGLGRAGAAGFAILVAASSATFVSTQIDATPQKDAKALLFTLLATGWLGLIAGWFGIRWSRSLGFGTRITLLIGLAILVFMANTAVGASLMFLSGHDLQLLLLLCGYAFVATAIPAFALGRNIGQRLQQVQIAAARIAAGDLGARVGISGNDDVGRLAAAFDTMASNVQDANERRDAMEQARRELFAAISHDLRTPLSSIRLMVEALVDGVVDDRETTARYLRTMSSDIDKLSVLIDDLFELARIESGALALRLETVALEEVLASAIDAASPGAEVAKVRLELSCRSPLPLLDADPMRLHRVILNLLQNAIRHTPADGSVTVSADEAHDDVLVEVRDTGEGIPEGDVPHIFERFYRAERSRNRATGGAGLGLSISRGIVEAHGGRIWVETTSALGTAVRFALPKAASACTTSPQPGASNPWAMRRGSDGLSASDNQ